MIKKWHWLPILAGITLLLSACSNSVTQQNGDKDYQAAKMAYDKNDFIDVIDYCDEAIAKGLNKMKLEDVYALRGQAYLELEMYSETINSYEQAIAINETDHKLWTDFGVACRISGDLDRALECYQNALLIDPSYAEAYSSIGTLYVIKDQATEAIEHFEKAIELNSGLAVTHGNLALALAMDGRFEEAAEELKKAKSLGYENADTIQGRIDALKSD